MEKNIPFKRLNCLSTDVIQQCSDCSAVLWHWTLVKLEEELVARQIIYALEKKGILVFPNLTSCWHYDDKVAQKYLFDAIGAPLLPTWVFTDQTSAQEWIAGATWPKVFKLRCGASSSNVRLVQSRGQARELCRVAFGRGFPAKPGYLADARTRVRKTKNFNDFWQKLKRAPRSLLETLAYRRRAPRQRGYLYFQEFVPGNEYDTRVVIIGDRAFSYLRLNRPNDFRASGGGLTVYNLERIDKRCIEIAFDVAETLGTQSLGFDFLFDTDHQPRICEMSYCYVDWMVYDCPGHWDRNLKWHPGQIWPQDAVLEDLLATVGVKEILRAATAS